MEVPEAVSEVIVDRMDALEEFQVDEVLQFSSDAVEAMSSDHFAAGGASSSSRCPPTAVTDEPEPPYMPASLRRRRYSFTSSDSSE